jgi:hypothetical protein
MPINQLTNVVRTPSEQAHTSESIVRNTDPQGVDTVNNQVFSFVIFIAALTSTHLASADSVVDFEEAFGWRYYCESSANPAVGYNWRERPGAVGLFLNPKNKKYVFYQCPHTNPYGHLDILLSEWRVSFVSLLSGEEFGIFCPDSQET